MWTDQPTKGMREGKVWEIITAAVQESPRRARILPAADPACCAEPAQRMHLSEASVLGSRVLNCGGLVLDPG
ncbi:DUF2625 family protein [Schaalia sp. 19OD2882]|uniref:DUF2625 family protein n=1 Tax=Schaalia sp. 19OD2882 TaxID=2794089 RepID=UPI001C1EE3D4|nr:DUF2625 family protein [Schaalia sp. 19OD2882]QWW20439.1 DUF2625 family protein [Schaalia sp. 19OD2882]